MKIINDEYDRLCPLFKHKHKTKDGEAYESDKYAAETPDEFRDVINSLFGLHLQGVVIEIIGAFVWLTGNTKTYKAEINGLKMGFVFHKKKEARDKSPDGYRRHGKKNMF